MKNKTFILFLIIAISFFGSISAQNKSHHKRKHKQKTVKVAETKIAEPKEQEKTVAAIKIDTSKTKLKTGLEIDSLDLSNATLKFLKKNAHASYYAAKFHGRRTASGKRYDSNGYTAAHKKLPFGTKVKVTNEANGKSVIVEITDRGPFSKVREIDLSKKAFMEIASNKNSGVVIVTLEVIEPKK